MDRASAQDHRPVRLVRQDLLRYEPILQNTLTHSLEYSSHSLFFPTSLKPKSKLNEAIEKKRALYIAKEKKVLIPLVLDDVFYGVFMAGGASIKGSRYATPHLFNLAASALEKILLHKQSLCDPLTGLMHESALLHQMAREIDLILTCIMPGPNASMDCSISTYSACFGLILVDLDHFRWINDSFGHLFGNDVLIKIARILEEFGRDQVLLSRVSGDLYALFWPQASPRRCAALAEEIRKRIVETTLLNEITEEQISITPSIGFSNFPQDMQGWQLKTPCLEQAHIFLEKSKKALDTAKESGGNQVCAFRDILSRKGLVVESLPMDRLVVNLGKSVDAAEGQRFLVWTEETGVQRRQGRRKGGAHYPPLHKGEVQLVEVQEDLAVAEILYLNDATWHIAPGDRLTLLPDNEGLLPEQTPEDHKPRPHKDVLTGLYPLKDFLQVLGDLRNRDDSFSMAMIHMRFLDKSIDDFQMEKRVQEMASLIRKQLGPETGGRYSSNTLIFYFSQTDPDTILEPLKNICSKALEDNMAELSCGVAFHPFLTFSKADILDNCSKALAHARLLPGTKVAAFNSTSINISADTSYTQGDLYTAIEEYKLALLADENNEVAKNSLGICFARLGKLDKARTQFETILSRDADNFIARYNFGCINLKLKDLDSARTAFEHCLRLKEDHTFSMLRLGQIAEQVNDLKDAETYYTKTLELEGGEILAYRNLARLALKQEQYDQAQEHLHQALIHNPKDAHSLHLLARMYLDKGDDPQIAESLARQSASLRPENSSYWAELIRALKAQGKDEEAKAIVIRKKDFPESDSTICSI